MPPFGEGRLDLRVTAEGYEEGELKGLELDPAGPDAEVLAELDPIASWVNLRILRGADEAIKGAELRLLRDGLSGEVAWEGKSGAGGLVKIPAEFAGLPLLVRADGHAFLVDQLPEANVAPVDWRLSPPPAQEKVVVLVVDQDHQPIAGAEVMLRVGGVWVRGEALEWLVGNAGRGPKTNGAGLMLLLNLPPQDFALLATPATFDPVEVGALAQLATRVDFPPPPVLVLQTVPD